MATTETKYNYDFKSKKVKRAVQEWALKNNTTVQDLITEGLKMRLPKLVK